MLFFCSLNPHLFPAKACWILASKFLPRIMLNLNSCIFSCPEALPFPYFLPPSQFSHHFPIIFHQLHLFPHFDPSWSSKHRNRRTPPLWATPWRQSHAGRAPPRKNRRRPRQPTERARNTSETGDSLWIFYGISVNLYYVFLCISRIFKDFLCFSIFLFIICGVKKSMITIHTLLEKFFVV